VLYGNIYSNSRGYFPSKKLPAAKLNSTNCIFDWNTEGPVIKAQSKVKMTLSSQHKPFTCYKDDPESIQHALKALVIPLWQALHPSTTTDVDTMELQEQEYFDLFVLAWGSISTWKTFDLKNKAMDTKVVVYRLSKTSPEVFESLWTKTGRLNIIEETKAWKVANCMLGSKWKLQQQMVAKRTTFLEIMTKTASASATKDSSTQLTNTSPSVSTPRTAVPKNPYAKKLASWRTKPVHQNMQRKHITYFEIKLPPASFVSLEMSADPGCELFNRALTALWSIDPDIVLHPYPSEKDTLAPVFGHARPLVREDPKQSMEVRWYTNKWIVSVNKWTYCRIKIGHNLDHSLFQDPEFQEIIKDLSMSVDIAGIQAPYITSVGWLFGSHVVTMNCSAYESKLRQHPLLVGFDVEVKPDKVLLEPEERKETKRYFPKAAHIYCAKEDAERLTRKLKMIFNLKTSINKPDGKDLWFVRTVLEPGFPIKPGTKEKTSKARDGQMAYVRKLDSVIIPFCHDLDLEIQCALLDEETRRLSLQEIFMCWRSSIVTDQSLFTSADRDYRGRVRVTFLRALKKEAHMIVSYLPILLEERFGPRVWGWFDKEAAQESLGNAYFDSQKKRIVDPVEEDTFDQYAIRGATGEMAELSDMMYSMDFENLEDESLGDNSVEEYDDLELEILVDPTVKFGIPPAYDTQSQASFATLSTAGASVTQESHQVQIPNDPDTPPGTSETSDDDLGVTITVPTSSVTNPNTIDDASHISSLTGMTLMALTPTDPTESQTTPTEIIQHQQTPRYTGSQSHE
jgi:hypothetical protein